MSNAILVPVDGSSFAEHALPYALGIARRTAATLHVGLVHVRYHLASPSYPLVAELEAQDAAELERDRVYLDELVERLRPSGVRVRPMLLHGQVVPSLTGFIEEHGIGLVVMTTHGRGGLQRAWLGSTADGLLRNVDIPLLLVRPSDGTREIGAGSDHVFRHVLAALDGGDTAEAALREAVELGVVGRAAVTLAHVVQPALTAFAPYVEPGAADLEIRDLRLKRRLASLSREEWLWDRRIEVELELDYFPAQSLLEMAERRDADLIVLGTHGRGGLSRMILGSVADKVIRGTSRPVLVYSGGASRYGLAPVPGETVCSGASRAAGAVSGSGRP
ncbi:MAG TPA: universal stress protein [Longimicrobiales bacterium]|nr:universal stress protein [Longimicrobiales bacterium]